MVVDHHQEILAAVPKVSGLISIACTIYILNEIRIDQKTGRLPITPNTRAVIGMSMFVLMLGMGWLASNWMVPSVTRTSGADVTANDDDLDGFFAPKGNMWTCRIQGFFLQMAIGPPLYNAAILWFAQLSILHNWSNEKIVRMVEVPTHCVIVIWCFCSACLMLLQDKYHSIGPICWASDSPNCHQDDSCNVKVYSTILYCIPLWIALLYTIASCIRIKCHVHRNLSGQKEVTHRADSLVVLYSLAIFITYTPCIIWSFTFWNNYESFTLTLLFGMLEPLQGIWNLTIFLMNRRQATRARLRKACSCWFLLCKKQRISTVSDDDDTASSTNNHPHPNAISVESTV